MNLSFTYEDAGNYRQNMDHLSGLLQRLLLDLNNKDLLSVICSSVTYSTISGTTNTLFDFAFEENI